MRKDIVIPEIKNVTVVVKPPEQRGHWHVHLVNTNNFPIENVLVATKGYSKKSADREETSVLRHFFEQLGPGRSLQIELIDPQVFHLFNEYAVTYYVDKEIYYKKFIFVPGSITIDNLIFNPVLQANVVTHA